MSASLVQASMKRTKCSELVTRQEERKQDSKSGLKAKKKIRGQPMKN
jgi:hypothetical protein